MEYKFTILVPTVYSKAGPTNVSDSKVDDFAVALEKHADVDFGMKCYLPTTPGDAFITNFNIFEDKFLRRSEYALILISNDSSAAMTKFYPRLVVFLSVRREWVNRFVLVFVGDIVLDESVDVTTVIHAPITFTRDWATNESQNEQSWRSLFSLLKVTWVPHIAHKEKPIEPVIQNTIASASGSMASSNETTSKSKVSIVREEEKKSEKPQIPMVDDSTTNAPDGVDEDLVRQRLKEAGYPGPEYIDFKYSTESRSPTNSTTVNAIMQGCSLTVSDTKTEGSFSGSEENWDVLSSEGSSSGSRDPNKKRHRHHHRKGGVARTVTSSSKTITTVNVSTEEIIIRPGQQSPTSLPMVKSEEDVTIPKQAVLIDASKDSSESKGNSKGATNSGFIINAEQDLSSDLVSGSVIDKSILITTDKSRSNDYDVTHTVQTVIIARSDKDSDDIQNENTNNKSDKTKTSSLLFETSTKESEATNESKTNASSLMWGSRDKSGASKDTHQNTDEHKNKDENNKPDESKSSFSIFGKSSKSDDSTQDENKIPNESETKKSSWFWGGGNASKTSTDVKEENVDDLENKGTSSKIDYSKSSSWLFGRSSKPDESTSDENKIPNESETKKSSWFWGGGDASKTSTDVKEENVDAHKNIDENSKTDSSSSSSWLFGRSTKAAVEDGDESKTTNESETKMSSWFWSRGDTSATIDGKDSTENENNKESTSSSWFWKSSKSGADECKNLEEDIEAAKNNETSKSKSWFWNSSSEPTEKGDGDESSITEVKSSKSWFWRGSGESNDGKEVNEDINPKSAEQTESSWFWSRSKTPQNIEDSDDTNEIDQKSPQRARFSLGSLFWRSPSSISTQVLVVPEEEEEIEASSRKRRGWFWSRSTLDSTNDDDVDDSSSGKRGFWGMFGWSSNRSNSTLEGYPDDGSITNQKSSDKRGRLLFRHGGVKVCSPCFFYMPKYEKRIPFLIREAEIEERRKQKFSTGSIVYLMEKSIEDNEVIEPPKTKGGLQAGNFNVTDDDLTSIKRQDSNDHLDERIMDDNEEIKPTKSKAQLQTGNSNMTVNDFQRTQGGSVSEQKLQNLDENDMDVVDGAGEARARKRSLLRLKIGGKERLPDDFESDGDWWFIYPIVNTGTAYFFRFFCIFRLSRGDPSRNVPGADILAREVDRCIWETRRHFGNPWWASALLVALTAISPHYNAATRALYQSIEYFIAHHVEFISGLPLITPWLGSVDMLRWNPSRVFLPIHFFSSERFPGSLMKPSTVYQVAANPS